MIFKKLKNVYKIAEAAAILEKVFEQRTPRHLNVGNYSLLARDVIQDAWKANEDLFSGQLGMRPHKVTVCLWSVVYAIEQVEFLGDKYQALAFSFAAITHDIERFGHSYDLSGVDEVLQTDALRRHSRHVKETEMLTETLSKKLGFDALHSIHHEVNT
jgi:hypothetical protein